MDEVTAASQLKEEVAHYDKTYRHPGLQRLEVRGPSAASKLDPNPWSRDDFSTDPGCYVVYGKYWQCLYVGKASFGAIMGARLYAHLVRGLAGWRGEAAHVFMVKVTQSFEAPSLEEFLIGRLKPVANSIGRISNAPAA